MGRMASTIQAGPDSCLANFSEIHEQQTDVGSESAASAEDMGIAAAADVHEESEYEVIDLGINDCRSLSAMHDFKTAQNSFRHAVQKTLEQAGAQLQAL